MYEIQHNIFNCCVRFFPVKMQGVKDHRRISFVEQQHVIHAQLLRWIFLVKMQGVKLMFGKKADVVSCCWALRSLNTYVERSETIWIETCPKSKWSFLVANISLSCTSPDWRIPKVPERSTPLSSNISRCKLRVRVVVSGMRFCPRGFVRNKRILPFGRLHRKGRRGLFRSDQSRAV